MDSNRIVGLDGKPLGPSPETPPPVGEAIQALVKAEIANQRESVREAVQTQFKELEKAVARNWRWLTILLALATTFGGILSWRFWSTVPEEVHKQLLEPQVAESVDRILTSKSLAFIDSKIEPLEDRTSEARSLLVDVRRDIEILVKKLGQQREELVGQKEIWDKQQRAIANDLTLLSEKLRISELSTAAKVGSISAFEEIVQRATSNGNASAVAKAALHEVEIFYDIDSAQIFFRRWVDSISKENPGFTPDELFISLSDVKDATKRVAIVNTIAEVAGSLPESRKKLTIEELYFRLGHEEDLMVRARIIRALGILAKQQFRPLDKAAVDAWWKLSGNTLRNESIYSGVMRAVVYAKLPAQNWKSLIEELDLTIALDPDAGFTRSTRAEMLLNNGDFDGALKELDEIDKRLGTYYKSIWIRGMVQLRLGNKDAAINRFNAAMKIAPSLEVLLDSEEMLSVRYSPMIERPGMPKQPVE